MLLFIANLKLLAFVQQDIWKYAGIQITFHCYYAKQGLFIFPFTMLILSAVDHT